MPDYPAHKIRDMSADEISQRVTDLKEELFNLRFRNSTRQLDNPLRIREVKRDIARLSTVLREHELGIRKLGAAGAAGG